MLFTCEVHGRCEGIWPGPEESFVGLRAIYYEISLSRHPGNPPVDDGSGVARGGFHHAAVGADRVSCGAGA